MLESIWQHTNEKQIQKSITHSNPKQNISFSTTLKEQQTYRHSYLNPPESEFGQQFNFKQITDQNLPLLLKNFKQNHQNKAMFLGHNHITDKGLTLITKTLQYDTTVKHLILSHNNIQGSEFAKQGLADLLKINRFIGWLVLNHNNIEDIGAKHIGEALLENTGIKHLVLSHNNISDNGVKTLLNYLNQHKSLESIFLDGNPTTEKAIQIINEFKRNNPQIKRVII